MYKRALLLAIAAIAAALAPQPLSAGPAGSLTYVIDVSETGNATVVMVFMAGRGGSFYTFLPRFENWSYVVWSGSLDSLEVRNSSAYFYYNVSFSYRPGPSGVFGMNITYSFPYASLYVGRRGWFMTPLLGASPGLGLVVEVRIRGLDDVFVVTINGVEAEHVRSGEELRVEVPWQAAATGGRVTVDYTVREPVGEEVFEERVGGALIRIRAAPFYRGFAHKIAGILERARPVLERVFGPMAGVVEFEFFLPKRVDLSTYGYVMGEDVNAGGKGPIHLNLALIRFKEGYLETTVVHEYVHLALGAAGVPANRELRWFHEGVAQYVSLEACEEVGIDVSDIRAMLDNMSEVFRRGLVKPGFVEDWSPAGNEASYYAASYYIVSELAERHGGLDFIRRVVEEIRARGGISTNNELVDALSAAAGEDLAPLFRSWGFTISKAPPQRSRLLVLAAAARLAAVSALSLLVILGGGRGYRRCPYCYAEVPRGLAVCPYCGYPLAEEGGESG
ncbi:MAG: hypothetical protein DRJ57_04455 [Thermoprotei archaeon]|nr:MAG: hypothetical protein DRJ57_04455 [Thermoprotei archaeon]